SRRLSRAAPAGARPVTLWRAAAGHDFDHLRLRPGCSSGRSRMNTRTVDPRTIWAVLAMEAGLALPIISLPAQGDRLPGVLGPLLLLALLPLGFASIYQIREVRDPSWRLLSGIGLALLGRLAVSVVPEPGLAGLAV